MGVQRCDAYRHETGPGKRGVPAQCVSEKQEDGQAERQDLGVHSRFLGVVDREWVNRQQKRSQQARRWAVQQAAQPVEQRHCQQRSDE